MYTRKALNAMFDLITTELIHLDIKPDRMILFGSYAKENVHEYTDLDLAIWNKKFTGEGLIDLELIRPIQRKFKGVDIKMYPAHATSEDFDPFIEEIERTGKIWDAEKKELRPNGWSLSTPPHT